MKSKSLVILAIVTVAVILAAVLADKNRAPSNSLEKQVLFQGLSEKINDVHSMSLQKFGNTLTLEKQDDLWVIREADNYPANFGKIKEAVIAVSGLEVLSNKTSNPDLYNRLGVEDPASEKSNSLLLELRNANNEALTALIVGNIRHSKSADSQPGLYVRLPDSDTALLVEGRLELSASVQDWFNKSLMDIDGARVSKIVIEREGSAGISLHRETDTDDFSLDNIPEGKEIQSAVIISRMSTMLESLSAEGAMAEEKMNGHIVSTTTLTTFDGLQVTIKNAFLDDAYYSAFSFTANENEQVEASEGETADGMEGKPSVSDEAAALNQRHAGWAYQIPDYKFELFDEAFEDLVRAPSAEAEGTPAQ